MRDNGYPHGSATWYSYYFDKEYQETESIPEWYVKFLDEIKLRVDFIDRILISGIDIINLLEELHGEEIRGDETNN